MVSAARAAGVSEKGREHLARTRSRGGWRTLEDAVRDTSKLWAGTWGLPGAGLLRRGGALRLDLAWSGLGRKDRRCNGEHAKEISEICDNSKCESG